MSHGAKGVDLVDPDMTPMLDVAFQLVAFFVVVTTFDQTQADERVKLPGDSLARPPQVAIVDEITLNIGFERDKEGKKTDQTAYVYLGSQKIPVAGYGEHLKNQSRLEKAKGGEKAVKAMTIQIRADEDTPTGVVQDLIRMSQDVGFEKFTLKARVAAD